MALPIDPVLPELIAALREHGQAVLQAPPGAGKTTRVPLAMLDAGICTGRILMLEPRRLATRAAAERMSSSLGEAVGKTVGYRMRGEAKTSGTTRIEVVTEGILTRMIQSDPGLPGIGAVIFDEFHERSLHGDLGLALTLEIRSALRPELMILPMSATLDAAPVAKLLGGAPIITAKGRSFPVEITWLSAPRQKGQSLANATAELLTHSSKETEGGILVFLPGAREIRDVAARLRLDAQKFDICPLYGALPFAQQRAAIAPLQDPRKRKIVLATSIAETSLTIEDIRVVIDAGQARRSHFDPGSGMSRLVTEKVTKAEITQRTGRAGRVAEGHCFRLWTKGEEGALRAYPPAEIEAADLSPLALELALWGTSEHDLAFLTPPPAGALAEARALLQMLGVLEDGNLTPHGQEVAALPLHPRLGHMIVVAGRKAAPLAAVMASRDPLETRQIDLNLRLRALQQSARSIRGLKDLQTDVRRIEALLQTVPKQTFSVAEMAALAYPDRIGKRRPGDAPRYILSGGKGAVIDAQDPLAGQTYIVATDLDGDAREARVRMGLAISQSEIRGLFGNQIVEVTTCEWSRRDQKILARKREKLGSLVLSEHNWNDAPSESIAAALCEGIRHVGLRLGQKAALFRARVELVRAGGNRLPDMSDAGLLAQLEGWLLPFLTGLQSAADLRRLDHTPALKAWLTWEQSQLLDREAPAQFTSPLGRKVAIDYSGDSPEITVRLQEMFGTKTHPVIASTPLRVTLLSPAQRPLQTTTDIPGFWATSYGDVRKDMRGRYPRHPWPEDPTIADPTLRAKPRKV